MNVEPGTLKSPIPVALIGAGLIGSRHAETLVRRLPTARLAMIADPSEEAANRLRASLKLDDVPIVRDYQVALADPEIRAVVIASPGATHPEVIAAAAEAGKPAFCEKPLGHSLDAADRALAAVDRAGTLLQIGFQRRFDAGFRRAQTLVADGTLGEVHLLRSLTRDPVGARPKTEPPWAIFLETLIHDFDVLRWLAGAEAIEVYAVGNILGPPIFGGPEWLDTALVSIRFANGALATADASFHAAYGYDARAEVFGARGMVTVGEGQTDSARHFSPAGVCRGQAQSFWDLFQAAYSAELAHFVGCVVAGRTPAVTGADGRASLVIALASIESVRTGRPVRVAPPPSQSWGE